MATFWHNFDQQPVFIISHQSFAPVLIVKVTDAPCTGFLVSPTVNMSDCCLHVLLYHVDNYYCKIVFMQKFIQPIGICSFTCPICWSITILAQNDLEISRQILVVHLPIAGFFKDRWYCHSSLMKSPY